MRFLWVCFQYIFDHGLIKHHFIFQCGVTHHRTGDQQQGKEGFEQVANREGHKHKVKRCNQHKRNGDDEPRPHMFKTAQDIVEMQQHRPVK